MPDERLDAAHEAAAAPEAAEDRRLADQAARIDALSRAYAALLEDNKAFRQRQERERARVIESERATGPPRPRRRPR